MRLGKLDWQKVAPVFARSEKAIIEGIEEAIDYMGKR
jgi:hypothetical protein